MKVFRVRDVVGQFLTKVNEHGRPFEDLTFLEKMLIDSVESDRESRIGVVDQECQQLTREVKHLSRSHTDEKREYARSLNALILKNHEIRREFSAERRQRKQDFVILEDQCRSIQPVVHVRLDVRSHLSFLRSNCRDLRHSLVGLRSDLSSLASASIVSLRHFKLQILNYVSMLEFEEKHPTAHGPLIAQIQIFKAQNQKLSDTLNQWQSFDPKRAEAKTQRRAVRREVDVLTGLSGTESLAGIAQALAALARSDLRGHTSALDARLAQADQRNDALVHKIKAALGSVARRPPAEVHFEHRNAVTARPVRALSRTMHEISQLRRYRAECGRSSSLVSSED
jgi:hypothetical protein